MRSELRVFYDSWYDEGYKYDKNISMSKKTRSKTKEQKSNYNYVTICAIVALVCDLLLFFALSQRFYLVFFTLWAIPFLNVLNFLLGKQISQTKKLNPAVLIILLVVAQILLAVTGMTINICINHGLNLCTTQKYCIISDYPFDFLLMVVLVAQFNIIGLYIGVVAEGLAKR